LDVNVLRLHIVAFVLTALDLLAEVLRGLPHVFDFGGEFVLVEVGHIFVDLDAAVDLSVAVFKRVALLAHKVHVTKK